MEPLRIEIPENIAKFVEAENCSNFNVNRYYVTQTQIDIINDILRDRELAEKLKEYDVQYVNTTLLYGPTGSGKAQPLYSKVLTPSGFVSMGDLKVGDKVISGTGEISTVLGIYPQGIRPIYEITFNDGAKCRCSDEHIWRVQTSNDRETDYNGRYRDVTLKEMIGKISVRKDGRKNYSIDYVPPIDFAEKEFVIHPYVMGALIGNGGLREKESIKFTTADKEVLDKVQELLPAQYELKHIINYDYRIIGDGRVFCKERHAYKEGLLRSELRKYGLSGLHSNEKFIPHDYLFGSYEQRLWLLRGLLDTDGYANKKTIEYSTTSERLANDIVNLVQSLGGRAKATKRKGRYKHDGIVTRTKDNYRISIVFSSQSDKVFYLSRKRDNYEFKRETIKRFITDIQFVGNEECQCIYIDDPSHLYITDNYVITHNTTFSRFLANYMDVDFVYLSFAALMDGGFGNTERNLRDVFRCITQLNCIFMIDEIDCIATDRTASDNDQKKSITVALMQELDHCKKATPNAIILAATNVPETLDTALRSRFSIEKEIPLLYNEDKTGFILKYLKDLDVPYQKSQIDEYVARNSRVTQRIMEQDIIRALGAWIENDKQGFVTLEGIKNY